MQCRHASFLGLFLRVVVLKVSGLEGWRVAGFLGLQGCRVLLLELFLLTNGWSSCSCGLFCASVCVWEHMCKRSSCHVFGFVQAQHQARATWRSLGAMIHDKGAQFAHRA